MNVEVITLPITNFSKTLMFYRIFFQIEAKRKCLRSLKHRHIQRLTLEILSFLANHATIIPNKYWPKYEIFTQPKGFEEQTSMGSSFFRTRFCRSMNLNTLIYIMRTWKRDVLTTLFVALLSRIQEFPETVFFKRKELLQVFIECKNQRMIGCGGEGVGFVEMHHLQFYFFCQPFGLCHDRTCCRRKIHCHQNIFFCRYHTNFPVKDSSLFLLRKFLHLFAQFRQSGTDFLHPFSDLIKVQRVLRMLLIIVKNFFNFIGKIFYRSLFGN